MANEMDNKKQDLGAKIKVTDKSNVKLTKKIGRKECQLTTFDLPYLAFFYNQKLLFYKGKFEYNEVVQKLKDGLGFVLEEFYPLAGKLGMDDDDDDGVFKIMYDDDMDGVEVAEAILMSNDDDDVMMGVDDVMAKEDMGIMMGLVPYNGVLNLEGLHRPLLAVQLTKLRDGLALGCAFNHAVLDGTSTWHFMTAWSHLTRGTHPNPTSPPYHDRTKARNTRVKLHLDGSSTPDPTQIPNPTLHLREKVFRFSDPKITQIKTNANNSPQNDAVSIETNLKTSPPKDDVSKPFTTFQSLSAHIWRHVTRARDLSPTDPTVFTIFVDCRKRVNPPMPETYFGNLIQAVFTGAPADTAERGGAAAIRAAIEAHDAAAIEKRNEGWEANPIIFKYEDAGVNCVAVGSSPRFRVYDVEFGFGQPEYVRSGSNNKFDGMVYLYPGKEGGIDVEMTLEKKAMENLMKDKEFLLEEMGA